MRVLSFSLFFFLFLRSTAAGFFPCVPVEDGSLRARAFARFSDRRKSRENAADNFFKTGFAAAVVVASPGELLRGRACTLFIVGYLFSGRIDKEGREREGERGSIFRRFVSVFCVRLEERGVKYLFRWLLRI